MSDPAAPTAPWQPTALDNEAETLIKGMEDEFKASGLDDELGASTGTTDSASGVPDGGGKTGEAAKVAGEPAAGASPQEVSKAAPELERQISREVEFRMEIQRREDALKAREALLEGRVAPDLAQTFRENPLAGFETLGLDPDQIVRMVIAQRLGDKAPPDLKRDIKESTRDSELRKELMALKAQLNQQTQASAARAYFEQVNAGAREYVTKGPSETVAPTVARVAKANPDHATSAILEEIARDAQVRGPKEPNGDVLSYEEAAKRVEARWAPLVALTNPSASTNAPTTPAAGAQATQPLKTPSTVIKTPDKPLAPWLQRGGEVDSGIKEAIAEYRRLEKV